MQKLIYKNYYSFKTDQDSVPNNYKKPRLEVRVGRSYIPVVTQVMPQEPAPKVKLAHTSVGGLPNNLVVTQTTLRKARSYKLKTL